MTPAAEIGMAVFAGYAAGATCTAGIILTPGGLVDPKTGGQAHRDNRWSWETWAAVLALWPVFLSWWTFNSWPGRENNR